MYTLDLKVGYGCNNNCIHCIIEGNKKRLRDKDLPINRTTEDLKREILGIAETIKANSEEDCKIIMTGGEPTIRKDFLEICQFAIDNGFKQIGLQTNGRKLSDREFTEQLVKRFPIRFTVALHADNPEIHDAITRQRGSFDETVQALKYLNEFKARSSGKIVISKKNTKNLLNTVKLFESLNVLTINIAFPHSAIHDPRFHDYVPRYRDIIDELKSILIYGQEKKMAILTEAVPYCLLKGYEEFVGENFIMGDITINDVDFSKTDWQKRRPEIKAKAKECENCYINILCEGPWEEYLHYYDATELMPISDIRESLIISKKIKLIKKFNQVEKSKDCE